MKKISLFLFAAVILFTACKSKKSAEEKAAEDLNKNISNMAEEMMKKQDDILKGREELEKLTPLTLDDLKKLIPETLLGAPRTEFNVSKAMGAGLATGEYSLNDSTRIKLNIYDCAGPAGAGIYGMQYLAMMNFEQESEDEYTKSISYGDGKAFEQCNKQTNDCTITWFAGGRYLVSLQADYIGPDALKKAGNELRF